MYRLIIVDDEVAIRSGLREYFPWTDHGFEVAGLFENGRAALNYLLACPVDVILCDIRMPVLSGTELLANLRERGIGTKVVFLSAHKDYNYLREAVRLGAEDYVLKPTKYAELSAVFLKIKSALDEERNPSRPVDGPSVPQQVVALVQSYIRTNCKNATLEEAASIVRMNPQYLSRYLKEKMGMTFSDHLLQVRMEKARTLLRDVRYKTYEVSALVGYSDENNFSRSFRRFFGVSPREFRSRDAPP